MASSLVEPSRPVYGPPAALPAGPARVAPDGTAPGASAVADPRAAEPRREPAHGPAPQVVVVGSVVREVDGADPRGWRLGGDAAYAALALARLGLRVGAALGVDAMTGDAGEIDLLREDGVEVHLVRLPRGPVFDRNGASAGGMVHCLDPGGPLPVASLPRPWRAAAAWLLAPAADELPDGWAAIAPGAVVALAWRGVLHDVELGEPLRRRPPHPRAILRRADIVAVGLDDLDPATDLRGVLRLLRAGALCTLTREARDGLACTVRAGTPRMRRFPLAPVGDGPGAAGSDAVFLAGLLAARVAPALAGRVPHLPAALRFAAAARAAHRPEAGLAGVATIHRVGERLRPPGPEG